MSYWTSILFDVFDEHVGLIEEAELYNFDGSWFAP